MTDLIPRDAAIDAVYHADSFELSLCGTSRIEERIELIPTIDPAAIREAALREAETVVRQALVNAAYVHGSEPMKAKSYS